MARTEHDARGGVVLADLRRGAQDLRLLAHVGRRRRLQLCAGRRMPDMLMDLPAVS